MRLARRLPANPEAAPRRRLGNIMLHQMREASGSTELRSMHPTLAIRNGFGVRTSALLRDSLQCR